jgi:hypothetical protein
MTTVRAQRLLNSVVSGSTTGTQLQTLLTAPGNLSDFQQSLTERGKTRLLSNNSLGAAAVMESETAFVQYFTSPICTNEFLNSPVAKAACATNKATIAASSDRMNAVFSNATGREGVFSDITTATATVDSQYMPNQWAKFFNDGIPGLKARNFAGGNYGNLKAAAYGNGVWVIVCSSGVHRAMRSLDNGVTWLPAHNAAINGRVCNDIAYGNGTFVVATNTSGVVITSADGASNWVEQNSATTGMTGNILGVRFANGVFVAVTSATIYTSTNGINWTSRAGLSCSGTLDYGNGKWIVAGVTGQIHVSTNNGSTWASSSVPVIGNANILYIAYTNGVWLAQSAVYFTSPVYYAQCYASVDNGVTWYLSASHSGATSQTCRGIFSVNGLFIQAGTNTTFARVGDGYSWNNSVLSSTWRTFLADSPVNMAYGNGQTVALTNTSISTMF